MIRQEEVFHIGRIGKPHGVKGETTFQFTDDVFDRVDADYLVLQVDGILVPFFMEEYRFRTDTTALIKFEDVDSVERAGDNPLVVKAKAVENFNSNPVLEVPDSNRVLIENHATKFLPEMKVVFLLDE